jgi:hypothetical protein
MPRMNELMVGFCCVAGLSMSSARADVWDLYDGANGVSAGVTCVYYNAAARLRWRHLGGDWLDAAGTSQGNQPFDQVNLTQYQQGRVELDVTGVFANGNRGVVIRSSGRVNFNSSESSQGPLLHVTKADGSVVSMQATADTSITGVRADTRLCAGLGSYGQSAVLSVANAAVIEFPPLPLGLQRAVLELTIVKAYDYAVVGAYAVNKPRTPLSTATSGIAASYPRDRGICSDPRVLYCEDWDTDPQNWWVRTGAFHLDRPYRWTHISNGVAFPPGWSATSYLPGGGFIGAGLQIELQGNTTGETATPTVNFVKLGYGEQEHLFYRYYLKYSPEFRDASTCDGGKHPGLAGDTSIAGNSGRKVDGTNGWSLRGGYQLNCDRNNPIYPRVINTTYAYHADMKADYGDHWAWTGYGDLGVEELNKWFCLEGEVRVNTPGIRDGVLRIWIDGHPAFAKTNLYLRGVPPYAVPGNLAIQKFWGTLHHGGTHPFGHNARVWMDQVVVAKSRIGCVRQ